MDAQIWTGRAASTFRDVANFSSISLILIPLVVLALVTIVVASLVLALGARQELEI